MFITLSNKFCNDFRTRTPSGSSTPIPTGMASKLTRKTSGASDIGSGRKTSKSTTPTDPKAPFRL